MLDLRERGIDLRVLNMDIGTSTTAGKLMFRIVSALAESERDLISERTRSALDAKRRRGELIGGRKPTDRKSTRLNSSHVAISYAVFCLKKKKHNISKLKYTI